MQKSSNSYYINHTLVQFHLLKW